MSEEKKVSKYEKVNQRLAAGGFGARPNTNKYYDIIVNGDVKSISRQVVTYDDIVFCVTGERSDSVLTIIFRHAAGSQKEGILGKGKAVQIDQGTVFSAYNTGNA